MEIFMPIYEYQCTKCDHQFDVLQKMQDAPIEHCPQCLNDTATRLVSAPGFQLKGTGWYETDFKHKGEKPATKTSTKTSVPEAKTDTASTQTTQGTAD
jgi:putative FmdB family regulatory protein